MYYFLINISPNVLYVCFITAFSFDNIILKFIHILKHIYITHITLVHLFQLATIQFPICESTLIYVSSWYILNWFLTFPFIDHSMVCVLTSILVFLYTHTRFSFSYIHVSGITIVKDMCIFNSDGHCLTPLEIYQNFYTTTSNLKSIYTYSCHNLDRDWKHGHNIL